MAGTITAVKSIVGGKRRWVLAISESASSSSSETSTATVIDPGDMPSLVYLTLRCAKTGSGTSATVQPIVGHVTGGGVGTVNQARPVATPGSLVEDGPFPVMFRPGAERILYFLAGFTSGSDNAAEWTVGIEEA